MRFRYALFAGPERSIKGGWNDIQYISESVRLLKEFCEITCKKYTWAHIVDLQLATVVVKGSKDAVREDAPWEWVYEWKDDEYGES